MIEGLSDRTVSQGVKGMQDVSRCFSAGRLIPSPATLNVSALDSTPLKAGKSFRQRVAGTGTEG